MHSRKVGIKGKRILKGQFMRRWQCPIYKDTFKSFFFEPDRPPCTNLTDPCHVQARSYFMSVPLTLDGAARMLTIPRYQCFV